MLDNSFMYKNEMYKRRIEDTLCSFEAIVYRKHGTMGVEKRKDVREAKTNVCFVIFIFFVPKVTRAWIFLLSEY